MSNKKFNYYQSELERLVFDPTYNTSIKIFDPSGVSTKQLDLTLESIPVLIKYLEAEKQRLLKRELK